MDTRFKVPYSHPRWWWGGGHIPICFDCAYFQGRIRGEQRCKAFPDGIPKEMFKQGATHDTPVDGDHGVRLCRFSLTQKVLISLQSSQECGLLLYKFSGNRRPKGRFFHIQIIRAGGDLKIPAHRARLT